MTHFNQVKHILFRVTGILLAILLLLATILGVVFFATIPFHNVSLWRMERAISSSILHPAETRVIERFSFLGSRYASDSECTYAVGEIRSTHLSKQELLARYENTNISLFGFANHMPVSVVIADEYASLPIGEPAGDWVYDFLRRVDTRSPDIIYYLVYLYETGRSDLGDYRCLERDL